MEAVIDFIQVRGELLSLLLAAAVLMLVANPVARLARVPGQEAGDLFWQGGIAFVLVARVVEVLMEAPHALGDPLALVRLEGGIEPLAGAAAVAAVVGWRAWRGTAPAGALLLVAAVGLVVAGISYDLACVLRGACGGAPAPRPFGFPVSGVGEPLFPAPLASAVVMLAWLGLVIGWTGRLRPAPAAVLLLGGLALSRALLTPLSALGSAAVGTETWLLGAAGLAGIAWGGFEVLRSGEPGTEAEQPSEPSTSER